MTTPVNDDSNQPPSSGDPLPPDSSPIRSEDSPELDGSDEALMDLFGGSAELAALAGEDSNELLRFIESSMSEDESQAFIAGLESRDPRGAIRLLRMQEDHRLLRTAGEVAPGRDLLGPVRERFARGESVPDSSFAAGSAEPTEFMERSVASLARRRRGRGGRIAQFFFASSMVGLAVALLVWNRGWFGGPPETMSATNPLDGSQELEELASFGLLIPVDDFERAEAEIAMRVIERNAILIRNQSGDRPGTNGIQPAPIVGILRGIPGDALRTDLADRGFQYAVIVEREGVATLLAKLGQISRSSNPEEKARLVSSSGPSQVTDGWQPWSDRSVADFSAADAARPIVVPIALIPSES